MEAPTSNPDRGMFRPEFIAAVQAQAKSDADAVVEFLNRTIQAANGSTIKIGVDSFDLTVVVGFAFVIRFRRWEIERLGIHIDARLPSSAEVFARMMKLGRCPKLAEYVAWVAIRGLQAFHESCLWHADDCDLRLDLAIVADDDERLLDAVADFLLQHIQTMTVFRSN